MIDSLICTGMVLNALYKLFHWTTLSISVSPTHSKVHDTKIFVGLNLFLPLPNLSKTNNMRTLYSSSSDQNDFQLHHPFLPPRSSFSFSYIFFCVLLLMSVMTTRKILKAKEVQKGAEALSTWKMSFSLTIISGSDLHYDLNPYGVTKSWKS